MLSTTNNIFRAKQKEVWAESDIVIIKIGTKEYTLSESPDRDGSLMVTAEKSGQQLVIRPFDHSHIFVETHQQPKK